MPRDIPIVFVEVDAIGVTTLPTTPRPGYSILIAAAATVGPLIGHEREIATFDVNSWIYTSMAKLAGRFILYRNPGTGLVKAYIHTGALVLTVGTEEFVEDTVDAAVATKVDTATITAKEAELETDQIMVYKGESDPLQGIPLPPADDAPYTIRIVRPSIGGAPVYSVVAE